MSMGVLVGVCGRTSNNDQLCFHVIMTRLQVEVYDNKPSSLFGPLY